MCQSTQLPLIASNYLSYSISDSAILCVFYPTTVPGRGKVTGAVDHPSQSVFDIGLRIVTLPQSW